MRLRTVKIREISITTDPQEKILEHIRKYLSEKEKGKRKKENGWPKPLVVVTPNPEQIVYAQKDPHFAEILNRADVALPDGVGISLAAKFLKSQIPDHNGQTIPRRIPGVEFMEDLVKLANDQGFRIALIGGRGGVALRALECLQKKYPRLRGWAEDGPEIELTNPTNKYQSDQLIKQQFNNLTIQQSGRDITDQYTVRIAEKIHKTEARLVFVGLGAPKQEYFIARQFQISNFKFQIVVMSVGGSFDIIAGRLPRAPVLIRLIGFEWAWRLFREPWRLRRQLALLKFVWLVLRQKLASQGETLRS